MKTDPGLAGRLIEQEARLGARAGRPLEGVCGRADGVYLWDVQGNRHLDLCADHGTVGLGHTHTRLAAAMVEQCLRLTASGGPYRNARLGPFLDKICTLTGFEAALCAGSEGEAVAAALKAARRWALRTKGVEHPEVLVFSGNDHGRDTGLLGLEDPVEGEPGYFCPGFRRVPYGDLAETRAGLGPRTAAILVEPVQAKGFRLPPRGFLKGLRDLCDAHGLLLLADETRSGLGRTGKVLALDHEGIRPDGVILGDALTGGFHPMGAFLGAHGLLDRFDPGAPLATQGQRPLACSVASAALDVLVEEHLVDRAAELGAYFLARLRALDCPRLEAVRGLGLWAALELREPTARAHCEALAQEGLLCAWASERIIALSPPLIITREQLDWALDKLERVLGR